MNQKVTASNARKTLAFKLAHALEVLQAPLGNRDWRLLAEIVIAVAVSSTCGCCTASVGFVVRVVFVTECGYAIGFCKGSVNL